MNWQAVQIVGTLVCPQCQATLSLGCMERSILPVDVEVSWRHGAILELLVAGGPGRATTTVSVFREAFFRDVWLISASFDAR